MLFLGADSFSYLEERSPIVFRALIASVWELTEFRSWDVILVLFKKVEARIDHAISFFLGKTSMIVS